jgi:hypothetical protein
LGLSAADELELRFLARSRARELASEARWRLHRSKARPVRQDQRWDWDPPWTLPGEGPEMGGAMMMCGALDDVCSAGPEMGGAMMMCGALGRIARGRK